jgi:hypothetical protein
VEAEVRKGETVFFSIDLRISEFGDKATGFDREEATLKSGLGSMPAKI